MSTVMNRTSDALDSFVATMPTDTKAAALLCELVRKIHAEAQGEDWDSPLKDEDQEAVETLERRLFFITAGKPTPMFVSVDLILASISQEGTFDSEKTKALTLDLIETMRGHIAGYLRGTNE